MAPALIKQSEEKEQRLKESRELQMSSQLKEEKARRAAELQAKIAAKSNKVLTYFPLLK